VPDLITATEKLVDANQSGIFNVVSKEDASLLHLLQDVLKLPHLKDFDASNENDMNVIYELSDVHVHNFSNVDKLVEFYHPTNLDSAIMTSYWELTSMF